MHLASDCCKAILYYSYFHETIKLFKFCHCFLYHKRISFSSKSLSPKKAVVLQQSSKDCDVASPNHFRPM